MMKFMMILLTLMFTFSSLAQTAQRLNKGDIAPFNGVLITEEKAVELYKAEKKVIVLEQLRIDEKELSEAYLHNYKVMEKRASRAESESFWLKVGLGVAAGFFIYRGVTK